MSCCVKGSGLNVCALNFLFSLPPSLRDGVALHAVDILSARTGVKPSFFSL